MADLEELFPGLSNSNYKRTSPEDIRYNCIAWSVGDTENWWWPDDDSFWPDGQARAETLDAFVSAYERLGFETTDFSDPEEGYEKVVLYASSLGIPTHAAKLLENGRPEPPLPLTGDAWRVEFEAWKRDAEIRTDCNPPGFVLDDSRETIYC